MDETIRKIIYNNCGIQDGATLIGYIEDILDRNNKAIEYIEENKTTYEGNEYGFDDMLEDVIPLLDILKGSDKE